MKSRLEKYLERQKGFSEEANEFRKMRISLVKNNTSNDKLVEKIEKNHNLDKSIIKAVNDLNHTLKKKYGGKYKFDFTNEEETMKKFDDLNIKGPAYYSLKQKLFEVIDKFEEMKNELERVKK